MLDPLDPAPRYSDADIDAIILAGGPLPETTVRHHRYGVDGEEIFKDVPRREALAERLETAARYYEFQKFHKEAPAASDVVERLESVRAAAVRMLAVLEANAPDESRLAAEVRYALQGAARIDAENNNGFDRIPPLKFTMQGEEFTDWNGRGLVRHAVENVKRLSRWAAFAATREKERVGLRENTGPKKVDENLWLGSLWGIYFQIYVKLPSASDGPFTRFVIAAGAPLGLIFEPEALRSRLRRLFPPSAFRSNQVEDTSGSTLPEF